MLSTVAGIYDPLGLLNPLVLLPRHTVQTLWNQTPKWDDPIDDETRDKFHSLMDDVEKFSLDIDRFTHLSESTDIVLVGFSDASQRAMAACVYCWTPSHPPSLLISKTRLAPIKGKSTIPKMELESLLMVHSLLLFTVNALRKEFPDKSISIYSYSDSTVTLHWCKDDLIKTVGPFVTNRVTKIHAIRDELTALTPLVYNSPRHVSTKDNPADHATRGLSSSQMNDPTHQWWIGPVWLKSHPDEWPNPNLSDLQCPLTEIYPTSLNPVVIQTPPLDRTIDLSRLSSIRQAITVTAIVYRFIISSAAKTRNPVLLEKLSHVPQSSCGESTNIPAFLASLTAVEKRFALSNIIRLEQTRQLDPDPSHKTKRPLLKDPSTGILRVQTRLTNCDQSSDFTTPILIPTKDSTLARLLIRDIHFSSSHANLDIVLNSLKSRYVIPRARQLVKSELSHCIPCRKTNNLPFRYPKSPSLPDDRVRKSLPFEHCGLDYAGPFTVGDNQKLWIALYTCFSTRLTHLEIVTSLLPSTFLLAFRRFCARRGTPRRVTSDKATTFRLASTLFSQTDADPDSVQTFFSSHGIEWRFTSAHSPWKGGIYERLIKIVKESFTRSIGKKRLTTDEFQTVVCEIEALLNSRPLSYVCSDEVSSFSGPTLRPIDLIMPQSFLGCHLKLTSTDDEYTPPDEENSSRQTAVRQLLRSVRVVDDFWKRWHQEYLTTLRDNSSSSDPLQSTRSSSIVPQRGSIVLVVDESGNTPRSQWHMAKILSLTDTSATLKSHAGRTIERPLNLLIPLEINAETTPLPDPDETHDAPPRHPMTTRAKSRRL